MKELFVVVSETPSDVYDSTETDIKAIFDTLDAAKKHVEENGNHGLFHGGTYSIRGIYINNENPNHYFNIEYRPSEKEWI